MCYKGKRIKVVAGILALLLVSTALVACTGPAGPAGPRGPAGPAGLAGSPGKAAVAPTAILVLTPNKLSKLGGFGVAIKASGAGFIPGEQITFTCPKSYSPSDLTDELIGQSAPVGTVVNEQGAFTAKLGIGRFQSFMFSKPGVYIIIAEGGQGSLASAPLLIELPAK